MATDSVEFWCGLFVGVSYVLSSLPGCDVGYDVSSMNSVSYVVNFFQIDTVARCSVLFDHFFIEQPFGLSQMQFFSGSFLVSH